MALGSSGCRTNLYDHSCSNALWHEHDPRWLVRPQATTGPSVAIGTTDVYSDPSCCRAKEPDITLHSSLAQTTSWPWVLPQVTQTSKTLATTWPLDTYIDTGGHTDTGSNCCLWWQHGTWMSTQNLAMVGPWTETRPLTAAWAQKSPWTQWWSRPPTAACSLLP